MKALQMKNSIIWVLALIFAVTLVLSFMTPLVADDYMYSFDDYSRNDPVPTRPLNLYDIFQDMRIHRAFVNGRVVPHFLAETFLMLPKAFFNVVNALVSALTFFAVSRFFKDRPGNRTGIAALLAFCLVWCLTPVYGQVFLWLDGAVNYSWCVLLLLLYIYPLYSEYTGSGSKPVTAGTVLWFLDGLLLGTYSEIAALAAAGIAVLTMILIRLEKNRIRLRVPVSALFIAAGYAYLVSAPSFGGKTSVEPFRVALVLLLMVCACAVPLLALKKPSLFRFLPAVLVAGFAAAAVLAKPSGFTDFFSSSLLNIALSAVLYMSLLSVYCRKDYADSKVILFSYLLFLAGIGTLSIGAVSTYFPPRCACFYTVLTAVSSLMIFTRLESPAVSYAVPAVAALTAAVFIFGVSDIYRVHSQDLRQKEIMAEAHAANQTSVVLEPLDYRTKYTAIYQLDDLTDDSGFWINDLMAKYYGFGEINIP